MKSNTRTGTAGNQRWLLWALIAMVALMVGVFGLVRMMGTPQVAANHSGEVDRTGFTATQASFGKPVRAGPEVEAVVSQARRLLRDGASAAGHSARQSDDLADLVGQRLEMFLRPASYAEWESHISSLGGRWEPLHFVPDAGTERVEADLAGLVGGSVALDDMLVRNLMESGVPPNTPIDQREEIDFSLRNAKPISGTAVRRAGTAGVSADYPPIPLTDQSLHVVEVLLPVRLRLHESEKRVPVTLAMRFWWTESSGRWTPIAMYLQYETHQIGWGEQPRALAF